MTRRSGALADGLVAGTVAAVLSGVPSTVHAALTGRDLLESSRAAGSIALPNASSAAQLAAAPLVHGALSLGWGVVLSFVLPRRRVVLWGAVAGLGIAALDLAVIGNPRRSQVAALPQLPQWADHVVFGVVVGWVLQRRERRGLR